MIKKLPILFTVIGFLALGGDSNAQIVPKAVSLVANPSSPSPGQKVTIQALTPLFDKNTSFFEWAVDGQTRKDLDGLGKHSIKLTAGEVGSLIRIKVAVSSPEGKGGQSALSIPVSDLALISFADTYKPPWYKGRALPVKNSAVNVVAIPTIILDGARLSHHSILYRWSLNGKKDSLAGVGKSVFTFRMSPYTSDPYEVSVTIEDIDKKIRKESMVTIEHKTPKSIIYPYTPLGGVETRNGTRTIFSTKKGFIDFVAEPFFLPVSSPRDLSFEWRVDSQRASGTPTKPNLLTVDARSYPKSPIEITAIIDDTNALLAHLLTSATIFLQ